ncbi:flagellar biosynthesis protein FliQ [Cellulosilyticum lentocellum]|uniref:Flagellar biosynthetic protein FliQ n=1 Tax=Cellulosilyticum lentocellum (strain ATCC 49066 / DSM 5427 / NCIMB 11756 / RHM5) TaxID=642492 RepID=F2JGQ6_CELLD|nr:flagellar biosynthesis protein FliQ [Cellulosilyticum lentocellum]ADZ84148.1 flagellar biosynthetic protein FliQ [Cellulosilyticum lentocellum DSM 5427]
MEQIVLDYMREALMMIVKVSLPILLTGLVVGLIISIFQTATSIQEQTLAFIPKIIAVFLAIIIFGSWIINMLSVYTIRLFNSFNTLL